MSKILRLQVPLFCIFETPDMVLLRNGLCVCVMRGVAGTGVVGTISC